MTPFAMLARRISNCIDGSLMIDFRRTRDEHLIYRVSVPCGRSYAVPLSLNEIVDAIDFEGFRGDCPCLRIDGVPVSALLHMQCHTSMIWELGAHRSVSNALR